MILIDESKLGHYTLLSILDDINVIKEIEELKLKYQDWWIKERDKDLLAVENDDTLSEKEKEDAKRYWNKAGENMDYSSYVDYYMKDIEKDISVEQYYDVATRCLDVLRDCGKDYYDKIVEEINNYDK